MYGMPQFGVLAAFLISAGVVIGLYVPSTFSLGGADCHCAISVRIYRADLLNLQIT
jgi:hypothetical protein